MRTLLIALSTILVLSAHAQKAIHIVSFSPEGAVPDVSQVHVSFSSNLYPLGEENHPAPMTSNCDTNGSGRWLSPKEWVFDFKVMPEPLTRCVFTFLKGLKSTDGTPISFTKSSYTVTIPDLALDFTEPMGSATLEEVQNRYGVGVDADQAFVLNYKGSTTASEVAKRVTFTFTGRKEPVAVEVLAPSIVKKIFANGQAYGDRAKIGHSIFAVKPKLDLPSDGSAVISLHDGPGRVLLYRAREPFTVNFSCSRDASKSPCSPIQPVTVQFSSEIQREVAKQIKAVPLHGKTKVIGIDEKRLEKSSDVLTAIFEAGFKAGETYRIELPKKITDIRGRSLTNANHFPLQVQFSSLPSVAKFPGAFGVIESENPVLPLSLRNVENEVQIKESNLSDYKAAEHAPDIINWMKRVAAQGSRIYEADTYNPAAKDPNGKAADFQSVFQSYPDTVKGKVEHQTLPDQHVFNQAEVIGVPLKGNGLHIVELESKILGNRILGRATPLYTSTAVLVTNLAVHFKWGKDAPSLVWVTELETGKPVSGANISIENCLGQSLAKGETSKDGTLTLDKLPWRDAIAKKCSGASYNYPSLVVMAKKGDDFSFTLDTFQEGIERWRFNLPYSMGGSVAAHTVLARDLLKPGQILQMKHYFREFHWQGFTVPNQKPSYVRISHMGSGDTWKFPVKFDAQGIASLEWKLPDSAHLGTYTIELISAKKSRFGIHTGNFEVEEFRLPTLTVLTQIPDMITQSTLDPKISLQGTYLSGGPASGLPVELRFLRDKNIMHTRVVGDYVFSQDAEVKEGVKERTNGVDLYAESDADDAQASSSAKNDTLETSQLIKKTQLDEGGSAYVALPKEVLNTDQDGEVHVSTTFTDPNGEIQSSVRTMSLYSRDRYLGISTEAKTYLDDPKAARLEVKLADLKDTPVNGEPISMTLFEQNSFSHRTKLVGGFYGYQRVEQVKRIAAICETKTNDRGLAGCDIPIPAPGQYLIEVNAKDSHGKKLVLVHPLNIYGDTDAIADYSESDRLTLEPNALEYSVGQDAKIAVRSSFKSSTALVTIERDGVMEHFVTEVSGDKPEIKLPIKREYAPNFVVSVFEVRPRLSEPAATGVLDLAKPAFKLGMAPIQVGMKSHELPIVVKTDQIAYQVRSRVKVEIETKAYAEVALAVVDKALLKLKPNLSFDLLKGMMLTQGHSVETSTMQMNLIGKRHFGKKATRFGGGGGKSITRELLDSLVAWKPKLVANAKGKIETEFELNDAISSFEVVAIGSEGLNLYGTGKTDIAATQDLQILSSIPITLREKDELPLQFVLRNTTLKAMNVSANLKVGEQAQAAVQVSIPAQSTKEVRWKITVPNGIKELPLLVSANANEGPTDALKISPMVVPAVPVTVRKGQLVQLTQSPQEVSVTLPKDAVKDLGGYRVQAQTRLSDLPESLRDYLKAYPYGCLEQQTSRAVGLGDKKNFRSVTTNLKSYLDSNSLLKFFPEMRYGSLDLTAYVLETSEEAGKEFKIPDGDLLSRLIVATEQGMRGQIKIAQNWWPSYLMANERLSAGEALSYLQPIDFADYEALKSIREPANLHHSLALLSMLDHSPESLVKAAGDRDLYLNEILSHYEVENTHLNLKKAGFYFFGPLLGSPDALRVRTLFALLRHDRKEEAAKLLRSLSEGLKLGSFDTTPADAWGTLAFRAFAKKYENVTVNGKVEVSFAALKQSIPLNEKNSLGESFVAFKNAGVSATSAEKLTESFQGTGSPWAFTRVEAAVPLTSPLDHGFDLKKEIKAVQGSADRKRGDLYDVTLTINARTAQTWVAVTDPIPTGASVLSSEGDGDLAFLERRADRVQAFYEYIPAGKVQLHYRVRLNQEGKFEFPPTRAEAMYDPTQYGEFPNPSLNVSGSSP